MIERASACVEPAAQFFLKNIEPPTRSHRVLGLSFWKHGGENPDLPFWWPLYLNSVRTIGQSSASLIATSSETSFNKSVDPKRRKALSQRKQVSRITPAKWSSPRAFTTRGASSAALAQQLEEHDKIVTAGAAPSSLLAESAGENGPSEAERHQHHSQPHTKTGERGPDEIEKETMIKRLLQTKNIDNLNAAWHIFDELGRPGNLAGRLFISLSHENRQKWGVPMLKTFWSIPLEYRTLDDHLRAERTALDLGKLDTAKKIVVEAVGRFNDAAESTRILLLSHLHQFQWHEIIWTLERYYPSWLRPMKDTFRGRGEDDQWKFVENMKGFPVRVKSLLQYLNKIQVQSPMLVSRLSIFAEHILVRLFRNQRALTILDKGTLDCILKHSRTLGKLRPGTISLAIRTLHTIAPHHDRSELALLLYKYLKSSHAGFVVPPVVYGMLISICSGTDLGSQHLDYVMSEFGNMHGKPDTKAYQRVMAIFAQRGNTESVTRYLREYCSQYGSPRDLAMLTPLLHAHARCGDVKGVEDIFSQLSSEFHLQPNTYCWNILLSAYAKSSNPEKAIEIFDDMRAQFVEPDEYSFGILMKVYSRVGDTNGILELVKLAREMGVSASIKMLESLVHSYCLNEEHETAEQMIEAVLNIGTQESSTRLWNILLRAYAIKGDTEALMRIQQRMKELAVPFDEFTHAALMTALCVIKRTKDAEKLLRKLEEENKVSSTPLHLATLLHGYVRENLHKEAARVLQEMAGRFGRITPGAQLSQLKMNVKTDVRRAKELTRATGGHVQVSYDSALEYLTKSLTTMSPGDQNSYLPSSRISKNERLTTPAILLDYMLAVMQHSSSHEEADRLLEKYESLVASSNHDFDQLREEPIALLTARMRSCENRQEWSEVDQLWTQIYSRGIKQASGLPTVQPQFQSFMQTTSTKASPEIIPALRFCIAKPLSIYILSLAAQKRTYDIVDLVNDVEKNGLALDSKNWNTYIQALCRSSNPIHHRLAFDLFETKMLPYCPPRKWLDDGLVAVPWLFSPNRNHALYKHTRKRKVMEKLRPDIPWPSYFTGVFLLSILTKLQPMSSVDAIPEALEDLQNIAPGTLRYFNSRFPRNKDRVQGIVIRGRRLRGDPLEQSGRKKPSRDLFRTRQVVLGLRNAGEGSEISEAAQRIHSNLQYVRTGRVAEKVESVSDPARPTFTQRKVRKQVLVRVGRVRVSDLWNRRRIGELKYVPLRSLPPEKASKYLDSRAKSGSKTRSNYPLPSDFTRNTLDYYTFENLVLRKISRRTIRENLANPTKALSLQFGRIPEEFRTNRAQGLYRGTKALRPLWRRYMKSARHARLVTKEFREQTATFRGKIRKAINELIQSQRKFDRQEGQRMQDLAEDPEYQKSLREWEVKGEAWWRARELEEQEKRTVGDEEMKYITDDVQNDLKRWRAMQKERHSREEELVEFDDHQKGWSPAAMDNKEVEKEMLQEGFTGLAAAGIGGRFKQVGRIQEQKNRELVKAREAEREAERAARKEMGR